MLGHVNFSLNCLKYQFATGSHWVNQLVCQGKKFTLRETRLILFLAWQLRNKPAYVSPCVTLPLTSWSFLFQWAGLSWCGCCESPLPEHLWLVGQAGNTDSEEERGTWGQATRQGWTQKIAWWSKWREAHEACYFFSPSCLYFPITSVEHSHFVLCVHSAHHSALIIFDDNDCIFLDKMSL